MPIGMISRFARSLAEAPLSRGYQSRGVAILRPSASVTTSSVAVNSTAWARHRLRLLRVRAGVDHHRRAAGGERERNAATDVAPGAGDDGDAACELLDHGFKSRLSLTQR
jgi:hypothetical protein